MDFSKESPFLATIKERYILNKEGSTRKTYHIVLDVKGAPLFHNVGDSIGVCPMNDPEVVSKILHYLQKEGNELIEERRSKKTFPLKEYLLYKANLSQIPSSLLKFLEENHPDRKKKEHLNFLLQPENKEKLQEYLHNHELWDLLKEHSEVVIEPKDLSSRLLPLLPRFYSIASSRKSCPDQIDLIVNELNFTSSGHVRYGVGSHFLCKLAKEKITPIPIYIHPSHGFTLPTNPNASLVMIGPGTGIAPFRAFLQERIATSSPGKNWLFFGERNRKTDFYYEDFLKRLEKEKLLTLDAAFSRDQEEKIYVQHKILQKGKELFSWIEKGAFIYVCGDAKKMAKDVEAALITLFKEEGHLSEENAKLLLRTMRKEKRYLTDVY